MSESKIVDGINKVPETPCEKETKEATLMVDLDLRVLRNARTEEDITRQALRVVGRLLKEIECRRQEGRMRDWGVVR